MTPLSDSEAATVRRFENAEPAPESWGGELRDALAEGLAATGFFDFDPDGYVVGDDDRRAAADCAADAVLALPELAALRAKADAADRVRELADELDCGGSNFRRQAARIRAALDGPPCVLAAVVPPRIAHAIARWLGLDTVIEMFCPCCPEWAAWAEIEETAA